MNVLIEVEDLSFGYQQQTVLENIQLQVPEGDFLAIVGPNGSGKSTLLKLLMGVLKPISGEIRFRDASLRSRLGYVSQKASQSSGFPATVKEVVASGLTGKLGLFQRMKKQEWLRVKQTLKRVGLEQFANRNIEQLSGGQKQRVFIARALVGEPQVLIMDEPTVGVDFKAKQQFYDLLTKLNKQQGLTIILVTHDLEMVPEVANQIVCLNRKVFFAGSAAEFAQQEHQILSSLYRAG